MNSTISNNIQPPTFCSVAKEYILKPRGFQQMVLLPAIRIVGWAEYCYGTLSKTAQVAQKSFKHTNHFFYWLQYPGKITAFTKSLVKLKTSILARSISEIFENSFKTYSNGILTINLFADLAKIGYQEKIVTFSTKAIQIINFIGFLGSTAFIVAGALGIVKRIRKLQIYEMNSPEFKLNFIHLINQVSLVAIGVLGVLSFTGVVAVPPLLALVAPTILLITGLAAYFYKNLVIRPLA